MNASPWGFFVFLLLVTVGALGWSVGHAARRRRVLADFAHANAMQFSARDRFALAERLAERLPCPGAAAVRVFDVMYRLHEQRYCYLCTVEYTSGVTRTKRRVRCVARLTEPRQRQSSDGVEVTVADRPGTGGYRELIGPGASRAGEAG